MNDRAKRRLMRVCALGNLDRPRFPAGLGSRKGEGKKTYVETMTYEVTPRGLHNTVSSVQKAFGGNFFLILAIFTNIAATSLYQKELV